MRAFREAVEASDHAAIADLLHEEVELHSPFAHRPFAGKEAAVAVLRNVFEVLEDFRYTDELGGDTATALVFRARVGDIQLQGVDLVRTGEDGRIVDFTVVVRPANGLMALGQAMAPRVEDLPKGPAPVAR